VIPQPAYTVVMCKGIGEGGPCGRGQALALHNGGVGARVLSSVSEEGTAWLFSVGWHRRENRWVCPRCAVSHGGAK